MMRLLEEWTRKRRKKSLSLKTKKKVLLLLLLWLMHSDESWEQSSSAFSASWK